MCQRLRLKGRSSRSLAALSVEFLTQRSSNHSPHIYQGRRQSKMGKAVLRQASGVHLPPLFPAFHHRGLGGVLQLSSYETVSRKSVILSLC
eukprot:2025577-Pleurochrysis_carterae.AAC.2